MNFKPIVKSLLISMAIFVVILWLCNLQISQSTQFIDGYPTVSSVLNISGIPKAFQTPSIRRPTNVPLTPFTLPIKVSKTDPTRLPPFMMYNLQYLTPIMDQGSCGACWATSVAYTLGDRLRLYTGRKTHTPFSVQHMISCYQPENACFGNSPEDLVKWLVKSRTYVRPEYKMKYEQSIKTHVSTSCFPSMNGVRLDEHNLHSLVSFVEEENPDPSILSNNIIQMKLELFNNGPFVAAMTVYEDFHNYSGLEVYSHFKHSRRLGGHAIEIIGYCNNNINPKHPQGYWICRNSWGSEWPLQSSTAGLFAIQMGSNECGVESRCLSFKPHLPSNFKSSSFTYAILTDYSASGTFRPR